MKFGELLQSVVARNDCAQIFVHFDLCLHPVAAIANRVKEMGGEIMDMEIIQSDVPHHSIVRFELSSEDVRDMVIELSENELFEVQGLNRRTTGCSVSDGRETRD